MSDTEKRYAVLDKFYAQHYGSMEPASVVDGAVMDAMADRIVELEAAVERVRALHSLPPDDGTSVWLDNNGQPLLLVCDQCGADLPCPTLRALEVGSE